MELGKGASTHRTKLLWRVVGIEIYRDIHLIMYREGKVTCDFDQREFHLISKNVK